MRETYIVKKRNGKSIDYHRIVAEQKLGRPLKKGEIVHHINGDKKDNRPENLEITTVAKHNKLHNSKERIVIFCKCGKPIKILESYYLWRKEHGQKDFYCSIKCVKRLGGYGRGYYKIEMDKTILSELSNGKTLYRIAKENNWNRNTVINHWNNIKKSLNKEDAILYNNTQLKRRRKNKLFWCNRCKSYLKKSKFAKNSRQSYGIGSYCKDCRKKFKC